MVKKCKIVMLSTNEPSKIGNLVTYQKRNLAKVIKEGINPKGSTVQFWNLYIISDDEIKLFDWVYNNKENIVEQINSKTQLIFVLEENKENQRQAKLGTNRTEITKQKISTARLGMKFSKKVKDNMKLAQQNRNYKHSEETLIKLSKAKKGKKGKEANNIRPIIDLSTNIEYSCIQEASEKLNIKYSKLYYHVRKGIKFKYK